MKNSKSQSSTRLIQVARELHRLADGIGAGHVQISGVDLTLADSVTLKVKQKMTGSKVVFDLTIQAHLASAEIEGEKGTGKRKKIGREKKPYGIRALKKKYAGIWRMIATAIKKREQPDSTDILALAAVSKKYAETAASDWTVLWQKSEQLVSQCIAAAQNGDFTAANEILREIGKAKKNCHKMYK
jgi:hypothetical protein